METGSIREFERGPKRAGKNQKRDKVKEYLTVLIVSLAPRNVRILTKLH